MCCLSLDSEGQLHVCWSEDVLVETYYHLRRKYSDISDAALKRIIGPLRNWIDPAALISGYDPTTVSCPRDPADRHVIAAAVRAHADYLVTSDQDLIEDCDESQIDALNPDDFLNEIADRYPGLLHARLTNQIRYLRSRDSELSLRAALDETINRLQKAGAPTFADRIRTLSSW